LSAQAGELVIVRPVGAGFLIPSAETLQTQSNVFVATRGHSARKRGSRRVVFACLLTLAVYPGPDICSIDHFLEKKISWWRR
jgi:hypothetical protein